MVFSLGINIESNLEDGVKTARRLDGRVVDNSDDAARIIADRYIKEARMTMMRNGSVVTGEGIASFKNQRLAEGKYGVYGASYLLQLDTGTQPHIPDTSSPRFVAWAAQHGFSRDELARSIARKGTRAHPWINESSRKIRKTAPKRVQINLNKAIKESMR